MHLGIIPFIPVIIAVLVTIPLLYWATTLRIVVPAHLVHIVQKSGATISYGASKSMSGNVYYAWPSWIPVLGLTMTVLPVNNFELELEAYEAFDLNKVPFLVDVVGFFRIEDTSLAAQRIATFKELFNQLTYIVQGSIRTILANNTIDSIMTERSKFGEAFTDEVLEQLKEWGVVPVKSLELMDIKDSPTSKAISNIMAKKQSFIEMESRKEVAENKRAAEIAEVQATREIDLQKQAAAQAIGERDALKTQAIGVAQQLSLQEIKSAEKTTIEKEMAVSKVQNVESANIAKEVALVQAEQNKQMTIIIAEGKLEEAKRKASGTLAEGSAKADAEKMMQLASVEPQIILAKEIGENKEYQQYLVTIETIKANQIVGVEQAKALGAADIKVIANTGDVTSGIKSVGDLFSSKGGTSLGAMVEAFTQTPQGEAIANKFFGE